jgi:hypothetical protein
VLQFGFNPILGRRGMKTILSIIGIGAALVMAAVSAAMNYAFLASLGKTEIEGQMLGAASASADLLKGLLPFFIAWAWRERRFLAAVSGTATFVLFAGFSLLSAIGFASSNREAVAQSRSAIDEAHARAEQEYQRKSAALSALPARRPAAVLAEELRAAQQSRLWSRSKECSEATEPASRSFCDSYFRLRAEKAAAEEAMHLEAGLATLEDELARLQSEGAGLVPDAQVTALSSLFGMTENRLRLALIIAVALVVELGSSLGLYLAAGPFTAPIVGLKPRQAPEAARPVGDIEDFVLAVLRPDQGGKISITELFTAYEQWCLRNGMDAMEEGPFETCFRELAQVVGLTEDGGAFKGIAIQPMAAAA